MLVLGLMSGSSCDGLDVALCKLQLQPKACHIIHSTTLTYTAFWKDRLRKATKLSGLELIKLDRQFGIYIAKILEPLLAEWAQLIDIIGWHGHTVFHYPNDRVTLQIGHGAALAAALKIDVVCDFRQRDVFHQGTGAPLAPIVERDLYTGYQAYINLGGICNISLLQGNGNLIASDLCGCNQLLDRIASLSGVEYDVNGQWASLGKIDHKLRATLNDHSYCQLPFPKVLDNTQVMELFWPAIQPLTANRNDALRTVCAHVADQIEMALSSSEIDRVLVTGGGVHNTTLIDEVQKRLAIHRIDLIVDPTISDCKEAVLMAWMALLYHHRQINVLSSVTGATQDSIGGCRYYGHDI